VSLGNQAAAYNSTAEPEPGCHVTGPQAHSEFLFPALRRLAEPATLPQFCDWFAAEFGQEILPDAAPEHGARLVRVLARELWRITPDPARRWAARPLPKTGRNDPCFCGSGRKFKQCCGPVAESMPPIGLEPLSIAGFLFALGPAAWREPAALRAMPGGMLAAAVHGLCECESDESAAQVMEPVFLSPAGLGDGCDEAFDMLMDAMQAAGLDARREEVARVVSERGGGRGLRCTAWCRLAVLAADRGEHGPSWAAFRAAQRENPDDPQLLHLELSLLLAEGRQDEARARASVLAVRARKLGYPELADMLPQLVESGLEDWAPESGPDEQEELEWTLLLREALAQLSADRFVALHDVDASDAHLRISIKRQALRKIKSWQTDYEALPPMLTQLDGDASAILDDASGASAWLRAHPASVASLPVLDNLVMAARQMVEESDAPAVASAARELVDAAADAIVEALERWPQAQLPWAVMDNRPALRIVAQAIDAALREHRSGRADALMRWMLARNPHDNHGWREHLRQLQLRSGDASAALELLDAYPDDAPPSGHDRALALFMLDRRAEAEATLRAAHAQFPAFVAALLPPTLDRPPGGRDDGLVGIGGAEHAWDWRAAMRKAWAGAGALAWLGGLKLPKSPKPAKRPQREPSPLAARIGVAPDPAAQAELARLAGAQLPRLLGWLAAVAWAPEMVVPGAWVSGVIGMTAEPADIGALNAALAVVMLQYNAMNMQRLEAAADTSVPLPPELDRLDEGAWALFAAGFVQCAEVHGRAAWRKVGFAVSARQAPFAALYQLAARAAPAPDGWRATGDDSGALLALMGEPASQRELLRQAMLPVWAATLRARRV
jgi:hypothetical protein